MSKKRRARSQLALSSPHHRRADGCTACKPRLSCDARSPDAPCQLLCQRSGWHPRAAIMTLRQMGTFMNADFAVPLALATQARVDASMDCYMDTLSVYTSADPSSQARVRSFRLVISCQHKLVTTRQLSVECPCTPPQTRSCPEKPH